MNGYSKFIYRVEVWLLNYMYYVYVCKFKYVIISF